MPTTSTTSTVDTTTSITATLAATTNISQDALNTSKTTAMSHSSQQQQQQQIPNTYLIGPIHNMSTGNGGGGGTAAAGAVTAAGSGGTTTTTAADNVILGPQGNTTFIAVTHQQLQQHQQSTAHSTAGIGPPATLTSNLLGFVGGIGIASTTAASGGQPVFVTGIATIANNNNNTSSNNNNNNPNDNNNNMDNTSEDSNPVTIYRCRAPIASLDCMEEFSGRSISLGSNPALPLRPGSTPTPGLRYKNLGKSGLRVSNVGLGTWPVFSPGVSDDQAEAILKLAIESGINLFDISEAHSETEIGKILQRTGWKRTAYVITTKVYWSTKSEERGLSRKHIIESVKASLQRLQLQYIDIVIIHKADAMCPMEEIVRAMNYIIQQGWAMYWGTARWTQVEIMEAYTNCRQFNCITPIVEQSEYHMFCREKCELYLPEMYNKIGVGLMAWGPLSMALSDAQNGEKIFLPKGSFKTKSHSYSWTEDEVNRNAALSPQGSWNKERMEEGRRHCDRLKDLAALAEKLGCTPTQLSIAWSLKHEPVQCLLLGATSAEQLHQSLQSLQLLPRLSTSVMLELERILENKPVRPPMISTLALR
ncbi:voltage-gated potassium channel subunit beta-2-like isoform X4 [Lucilia sericata]|uniref:voltage-gated potassium channel subunit beta-2-like isoform X4 n=1 Tax=Lucilia sericata TaxID=13632 RepID=UPI0018A84D3E|nr:voltage-gated potassium channel subunit beta-2-like isoform X4 [Lucilia sericata]